MLIHESMSRFDRQPRTLQLPRFYARQYMSRQLRSLRAGGHKPRSLSLDHGRVWVVPYNIFDRYAIWSVNGYSG